MQVLSTEELQQLEPGLQQTYHRATWIKDAASVDNPAQVTLAYRKLFIAAGGQFRLPISATFQRHRRGLSYPPQIVSSTLKSW